MNPVLLFTVFVWLVFASARVTRLIAVDTITMPARTWALRRARHKFGRSVATGLSCVWCVGWWCSLALVLIVWAVRPLPLPLLWPFAVAGGQMLVNGIDLHLDTH